MSTIYNYSRDNEPKFLNIRETKKQYKIKTTADVLVELYAIESKENDGIITMKDYVNFIIYALGEKETKEVLQSIEALDIAKIVKYIAGALTNRPQHELDKNNEEEDDSGSVE